MHQDGPNQNGAPEVRNRIAHQRPNQDGTPDVRTRISHPRIETILHTRSPNQYYAPETRTKIMHQGGPNQNGAPEVRNRIARQKVRTNITHLRDGNMVPEIPNTRMDEEMDLFARRNLTELRGTKKRPKMMRTVKKGRRRAW